MSVHPVPSEFRSHTFFKTFLGSLVAPYPVSIQHKGNIKARCPSCGFTVRGPNHGEGAHHKQASKGADTRRKSTGK